MMREMTTKEVQQMSLDILEDIHEFCEEHDVYYTLCGGSLIGAVRHRGFIPWDDDVDIAMPRPDYERFIKTYQSKNGYRLFSRESIDDNGVYIAYSRVCEMEKTYVDASLNPWCQQETGVWIDIMPLDGACGDENAEKKRWNRSYVAARMNGLTRTSAIDVRRVKDLASDVCVGGGKNWLLNLYLFKFIYFGLKLIIAQILFREKFKYCDKIISICKECDYAKSPFFTDLTVTHYGMREYNPKSLLEKRILQQFEDKEFYVLSGYDQWLTHIYGDYMKLPAENKRKPAHDANKYFWRNHEGNDDKGSPERASGYLKRCT